MTRNSPVHSGIMPVSWRDIFHRNGERYRWLGWMVWVGRGEVIPLGYGIIYRDWYTAGSFAAPWGLNILWRLGWLAYCWLTVPWLCSPLFAEGARFERDRNRFMEVV